MSQIFRVSDHEKLNRIADQLVDCVLERPPIMAAPQTQ